MTTKLSRRDFLRILKIIFLSMFSSGPILVIYSLFGEPTWLDVEQVEIVLPRLPKSFSGLRILHISDIHIGGWMNRAKLSDVIALAKIQKPDLVVMTGDYVIGHSWSENLDGAASDFIAEVSKLTAEYLVLGVLGNHDHWTDAEKVRTMLSKCGVKELNNGVHSLRRGEDQLHIAGVDDVREHKLDWMMYVNFYPNQAGRSYWHTNLILQTQVHKQTALIFSYQDTHTVGKW